MRSYFSAASRKSPTEMPHLVSHFPLESRTGYGTYLPSITLRGRPSPAHLPHVSTCLRASLQPLLVSPAIAVR